MSITKTDARRILLAALEAHGGNCTSCTADVVNELERWFPSTDWQKLWADYKLLEEVCDSLTSEELKQAWVQLSS